MNTIQPTVRRKKSTYAFIICFIAALGGLLFGLDQGFINGSLKYIIADMHLTTMEGSSFAAIMLLGCVVGSLCSGYISKTFGRKNTLMATAFVFTLFSFLSSFAHSIEVLTTYRIILGFSVGVASFVVPLYLSEIAPTRFRGGFIAMYQMMLTVGIFLIFITNDLIGRSYASWRPMFYAITIPALIMLLGSFLLPKSPRWLFLKKRENEARAVLEKTLSTQDEVELELKELKETAEAEKDMDDHGFFSMLKQSFFVRVLLLGVSLQVFQQLTGINSVIYYSTSIFHAAGVQSATLATIIIGLVNMLTTIIAVLCLDKLGRKPIMYFGYVVMALALLVAGFIFQTEASGVVVGDGLKIGLVVATVIYIFAFAISAGPIAWVLCAEVFPLKGRDLGVTVTTATNWIFAYIVVQFSLPMMTLANGKPNFQGGALLFYAFAMFCIAFLFILKFFVPETKGITLEELEENLIEGKKLRNIGNTRTQS